ncbi:hypothetical protein [Halorarum salinum]|uniref:DUF2238 domain-containing protein n=1 Tax=Halorarum salinum TaxID=2743089 RepID=A0A7D5QI72_9EURY|nr:hypothetical protein [Halobaculum salinum]QLG62764.1 hypothetical protein HUG12_13925 [Halobaculum salinum]
MRLRDRLRISPARQRRLTRLMQIVLVGLLFIGLERGSTGIIVNASVALAVSYLPALLEREYDLPMDAGLTLWITSAIFLHALGTVGLPGASENFYRNVPWWDHLTHALSSSVVAATGYTVTRAIEEHSDAVSLPPRFMFVFILLFVLAFGVFWEVLEFALAEIALALGTTSVLTQYGLEDTLLDLVFDTIGGIIVAVWGTAHLTDITGALTERLDERRSRS